MPVFDRKCSRTYNLTHHDGHISIVTGTPFALAKHMSRLLEDPLKQLMPTDKRIHDWVVVVDYWVNPPFGGTSHAASLTARDEQDNDLFTWYIDAEVIDVIVLEEHDNG
jgi:hypothetical protein